MDASESASEIPFFPESPRSVKLHVELGDHGGLEHVIKKTKAIKAGQLNNFLWNPQVADRVREYQPRILSIDGLRPLSLYLGFTDYDIGQKIRVWQLLPDRPSRLNEKGEVVVIAGDLTFDNVPTSDYSGLAEERRRKIDETIHTQDDHQSKTIKDKERNVRMIHTGAAGILLAAITAGYFHKNLDKGFSRRDVLKFSARTLSATAIGASLGYGMREGPEQIMSSAPTEKLANIAEYIASKQAVFLQNTWLDGRTALLISKALEAGSEGITPTGSEVAVVMGSNHGYASYELSQNKEKRMEAIGKYYKSLVEFMNDVHQKFPEINTDNNLGYLKMLLMRAERLIVTDSENMEEHVDDVEGFMNEHVKFDGFFESQEVREAIERIEQKSTDQVKIF